MRSFWEALGVQRRVWAALFLREMQTRWGRRNLGFAWLFAEPLVFAFPVLYAWAHIRQPVLDGMPMIAYTWSGYLPLLVFRHITGRSLLVVRNNSALLYHRTITPFDLFVASCCLEALGNLSAAFLTFLTLYMLGVVTLPYDIPLVIVSFLYMTWWSLAVALIVAALSERYELVIHIWMVVSYLYMIVCGWVFLSDWLPPPLRAFALAVDPPLHIYDMERDGLFGPLIRTHYDTVYLTYMLAGLTLVGLWLMRQVRTFVEVQ